jgi:glycosyltransferase involved in cell wall biosynthesis
MRIGYLMNIYPVTSATFIRREIAAIERQGTPVTRYAIRRWDEALVDPADRAEQERTHYLLSGRVPALVGSFFPELIQNPKGMWRAIRAWAHLLNNARDGFARHCAYLLEAISLKRAMAHDGIEHLHAHWSTNTAAVALMAHRLGGPSFSFTAHGPDEFVDPGPASLKFKVEEAGFVAAISNYCRTRLALAAGHGVWEKLHIIRCGIGMEEFAVSDAPFDEDAPFVCVGRLCPQKAQVLLMEATAEVARTHPHVRVELVGDGESRAEVEAAIAKHGLADHVTLLGWQDNAQVRARLGRARALLLPSFAEGLPVVIMEALALGRPAISTYIAGIPELVDDETGWIIPAGSVAHIADAMRAALDAGPETLKAKGLAGRARVEAQHDVEANAAALRALMGPDGPSAPFEPV